LIAFYDITGELIPVKVYEDYSITHKSDGCDQMQFFVDTKLEQYPLIHEESSVVTDDNLWIIKKIDDDRIDCELDFDFLKQAVYYNFNSESKTLAQQLEAHLPHGWVVIGANVSSISRTISFDICTDYDIVYACMATYDVRFVWKMKEKRLYVYNPDIMPSTGEYLTSELNLKSISYKGSTTGFATRLYAYGKNGLSIADAVVNGERYGLAYVEDKTYSNKVVCACWTDDRYTVAENLLEDAIKKLHSMANPIVSYECKVADLAKQNSDYDFLTFAMFKRITLIDIQRSLRVEHHIVEYTEYPDEPNRNTVTLSTVPDTISSKVSQVSSRINEELEKAKTAFDERMAIGTALMLNAFGGYPVITEHEIFIMDNPDQELAETVWRFNINGIGKSTTGINGPYTTSLTVNDEFVTSIINAMIIRGDRIEAGSITANQISTEYTDGERAYSTKIAADSISVMYHESLGGHTVAEAINGISGRLTTYEARTDEIKLQFSELTSGGTNLIRNSSGLNGVSDEWKTEAIDTDLAYFATTEEDTNTVSGSCFRISENTVLSQGVDGIFPDRDYRLSFKVRKTSNQLSKVIIVYGEDDNGEEITEEVYSSSSATNGWVIVEHTLSNSRGQSIRIKFLTNSDYFDVADIMLNEGNITKAWEPAPNEIYTQGVKIDKEGIEVYRSDTSEKTVINNTEFAGYFEDEKVFSINKDETHIKKTVVDGELIIGKGRIMPFSRNGEKGISITIIA
jgi:phage minor structural protein